MDKTARMERIREKLKVRSLLAQESIRTKHPHAHQFFQSKGFLLGKVRHHASKLLAAGSVSGSLLLASPQQALAQALPLPAPIYDVLTESGAVLPENPKDWLSEKLQSLLPPIKDRWALPFLSKDEERASERLISRATQVPVRASLEGEHLSTIYGVTGYEQHLQRYPGDTIAQHDEFRQAGIAPGLGAWGYFAYSKNSMTELDWQREKYYVAVQTLYLPHWNKRFLYLRDWYKYRKVLVVNPKNGNAVVAVIGDAGPAAWTGKHFGGSPEVMNHLGGPKYRAGEVLLLFVDDPENKVPLGPVDYDKLNAIFVREV